MKYAFSSETPIGPLTLVEEDGALIRVCFGMFDEEAQWMQTPLLHQGFEELEEYFRGERKQFSVPLRPQGTPFQLHCWEALVRIPYGETRTYAQQAQAIGNPRACRAVGMANHRNPLPVFIPCHRVIGSGGTLTGYAGGLSIKETLLRIERNAAV